MENVSRLLSNWNLDGATVSPIDSSSHTAWDVDGTYVLKRYRRAEEAAQSIELSGLLLAEGIPVSKYIPDKNGRLSSPDGLFCLMSKLPGKHIDFYEEPQLASVLGRELARLHLALGSIAPKLPCHDVDLLSEWREKYKPSVLGLLADEIAALVDEKLQSLYPSLPRQLIHRDVHPQNMLFDAGQLSGWLDFDIGQKNLRLFDLAYFLSGLLVGNTNDPAKMKLWRGLFRDLLSGYDSITPLSQEERDALPVLMIVIECLFVWYWITQENREQRDVSVSLAQWLYEELFR